MNKKGRGQMPEDNQHRVLYLPDLTWPEVKEALPQIKMAIIPVGSTEQHGPHGRFQTDYAAAREFSLRLGQELYPNALVTTPVPIGISEHHIHFPGTLSLRATTLVDVLMDIAVSLEKHGIRRFFFVNGHGGNTPALTIVTSRIRHEMNCKAAWSTLPWDLIGDLAKDFVQSPMTGHSCEMEMSIMLYIWPQGVKEDALTAGKIRQEALDRQKLASGIHESHFFDEVTENGALGDATKASAEWGKKAVETGLQRLLPYMREFMSS